MKPFNEKTWNSSVMKKANNKMTFPNCEPAKSSKKEANKARFHRTIKLLLLTVLIA